MKSSERKRAYDKAHYEANKEQRKAYGRAYGKQYREAHRGRTGYRSERQQAQRAELTQYKLERGCDSCGYKKNPAALGFHHVDPATKTSRAITYLSPARMQELKGMPLLCANCHLELHHPIV